MKKLNKKGFTIVELVIVIAVIAILAAVMVPTFSGLISDARETAAKSEAANAYHAAIIYAEDANCEGYYIKSGDYWFVVNGGVVVRVADADAPEYYASAVAAAAAGVDAGEEVYVKLSSVNAEAADNASVANVYVLAVVPELEATP